MPSSIYLDHNATTPLCPSAAEAMARAARDHHGNPASQHQPGRQARRAIEEARERIAELLGAAVDSLHADQLIFTSGGTEANNLAIFGLGRPGRQGLILSTIEHPSVGLAAQHLAHQGEAVGYLACSGLGNVRSETLDELLCADQRLVSVMLGNHETGAIQNVAHLATVAARHDVPLHCDAVQAVGKIPVDFRRLGAAALSLSAHKFHGPVGIGALLLRSGETLQPRLFGGFQQSGWRPGTESVVLVAGMRAALETALADLDEATERLRQLRDSLERRLLAGCQGAVVHAQAAERLAHVSCIALPGVDRQALLMALDLAGVACSTGSACASGSSEPSPVLLAMGIEPSLVQSSLRFSLGRGSQADEVAEAAERICKVYNDLRGSTRRTPGNPARGA